MTLPLRLLLLATLFFTATFAHAGNAAHPILFVTPVPIPEETMTVGAPSGPSDASTCLFQRYEVMLPSRALLDENVKPVLTVVVSQPAYNDVSAAYAPGNRIVFASDQPYNAQAHLVHREEYLGLPTVSGLWSLDPSDASSLKLFHHAPTGASNPFVDSAGRVIFTNWDHLSRDSEAVTDFRPPDPTYNESWVQTHNGSGNYSDESAGATFLQVTSMANDTWDLFPEPRNFDRTTLALNDPNLNGNAFNIFMPWMMALDGTGGELLNHLGRHEIGASFTKSWTNDANVVDLNPATAPSSTDVPIADNPAPGGARALTVTLSSPAFGSVGSPSSHALTDGLLVAPFGVRGPALTAGAVGSGAMRDTPIETYLSALTP